MTNYPYKVVIQEFKNLSTCLFSDVRPSIKQHVDPQRKVIKKVVAPTLHYPPVRVRTMNPHLVFAFVEHARWRAECRRNVLRGVTKQQVMLKHHLVRLELAAGARRCEGQAQATRMAVPTQYLGLLQVQLAVVAGEGQFRGGRLLYRRAAVDGRTRDQRRVAWSEME